MFFSFLIVADPIDHKTRPPCCETSSAMIRLTRSNVRSSNITAVVVKESCTFDSVHDDDDDDDDEKLKSSSTAFKTIIGMTEEHELTNTTSTLLELPDVLIFHIVSYVASPTNRAHVICHQLAPLCTISYDRFVRLDQNDDSKLQASSYPINNDKQYHQQILWETILKEDYGTVMNFCEEKNRRTSTRLRQSPMDRVRNAHLLMNDNSEIAFFYLNSLVLGNGDYSASIQKSPKRRKIRNNHKYLSLNSMKEIFLQYGPKIRVNSLASTGGTFLVEVCRAKNVPECVILQCVRELVEKYGADVNFSSNESIHSHQTPLCVAAVRGMVSVVRYLLVTAKTYADPTIRCSGRFALHTGHRKSLKCMNKTPYEFACAMKDAEIEAGCTNHSTLYGLTRCMQYLEGMTNIEVLPMKR